VVTGYRAARRICLDLHQSLSGPSILTSRARVPMRHHDDSHALPAIGRGRPWIISRGSRECCPNPPEGRGRPRRPDDRRESTAPAPTWLGAIGQMIAAVLRGRHARRLVIGAAVAFRRLLP
jgi:hypothetical protein